MIVILAGEVFDPGYPCWPIFARFLLGNFTDYDCAELVDVSVVTINDNLFAFIDIFEKNNYGKVNHMISQYCISADLISFFA
nr:AIF_HP1_G0030560.mRNA.1.CDS.1 [Saccharomyces cerevisiae]